MPAYGDTDRVMYLIFTAKMLMTYFQRVSGYLQYNFLFLYYHISFVSIYLFVYMYICLCESVL